MHGYKTQILLVIVSQAKPHERTVHTYFLVPQQRATAVPWNGFDLCFFSLHQFDRVTQVFLAPSAFKVCTVSC